MAIKLPCPRCKRPLSVPNKKAGGYVQCPQCNGRLWVPKDAPADATHVEEVIAHGGSPPPASPAGNSPAAAASPVAPKTTVPLPPPASSDTLAKVLAPAGASSSPSPAVPTRSAPAAAAMAPPAVAPRSVPQPPFVPGPSPVAAPSPQRPAPTTASPAAPPVAQQQPGGRKVAHFISAEAAQSTLTLAADGKLPELHLEEGERKEKDDKKQKSVNPLILVIGLGASVVMSILLAVSDLGPGSSGRDLDKSAARRLIREKYYNDMDRAAAVKPYQQMLRSAELAHVRADYNEERRLYRDVLDLLHAEGRAPGEGLAGSPDRDRELERLISILLSDN